MAQTKNLGGLFRASPISSVPAQFEILAQFEIPNDHDAPASDTILWRHPAVPRFFQRDEGSPCLLTVPIQNHTKPTITTNLPRSAAFLYNWKFYKSHLESPVAEVVHGWHL
jgi:hypothetical protein